MLCVLMVQEEEEADKENQGIHHLCLITTSELCLYLRSFVESVHSSPTSPDWECTTKSDLLYTAKSNALQ
jgi:hypothetical protein